MYDAIEMGPVASIVSAIVFARGVDHCRGVIAGRVEDSERVLLEDHLWLPALAASSWIGFAFCLKVMGGRSATLYKLSRSRVILPCRISVYVEHGVAMDGLRRVNHSSEGKSTSNPTSTLSI